MMPTTTANTPVRADGTVATRVTVFGPNLSGAAQRKGTFHVHASDCADCKLYGPGKRYRGDDNGFVVLATSVHDIVADVYPPEQFDYSGPDDESYEQYVSDFFVAPCVTFPKPVAKRTRKSLPAANGVHTAADYARAAKLNPRAYRRWLRANKLAPSASTIKRFAKEVKS